MSVTIDDQKLAIEELGLKTVGQVLTHATRQNRLVVNVLIDGQEPDLDRMATVRAASLLGRTIYVETAGISEMTDEVLAEVESHIAEADTLRAEAVDALQTNQQPRAMQKLNSCFGIWQHAQESIAKVAQLSRLDLERVICADGQAVAGVMTKFVTQLREIKTALEARDFVALGDVLGYEMEGAGEAWRQVITATRLAAVR